MLEGLAYKTDDYSVRARSISDYRLPITYLPWAHARTNCFPHW